MLNPMTPWTPGMNVRYHGSLTSLHGTYQAHPCTCLRCNDPILGTVRYALVDEQGTTVATCVRAGSLSLPEAVAASSAG
ncbi:hypothetical protein [Streptomyces sp. t39]|uniref:hypothetical protein n=1 Tax=Streptomyces sp. t39 TaxID=1828156 RepID=UPI0011CDABBF|nr:hypothetical protein [Streptomyces sp. t39]TXS35309.1 hypothetical protein EAO77_37095 [Streptomyces sp. t39]